MHAESSFSVPTVGGCWLGPPLFLPILVWLARKELPWPEESDSRDPQATIFSINVSGSVQLPPQYKTPTPTPTAYKGKGKGKGSVGG